jgi:hypothetical protein
MAVIHSLSPGFENQVSGVSPAAGQKTAGLIEEETNSSPRRSQRALRKAYSRLAAPEKQNGKLNFFALTPVLGGKNLCGLCVLCG